MQAGRLTDEELREALWAIDFRLGYGLPEHRSNCLSNARAKLSNPPAVENAPGPKIYIAVGCAVKDWRNALSTPLALIAVSYSLDGREKQLQDYASKNGATVFHCFEISDEKLER